MLLREIGPGDVDGLGRFFVRNNVPEVVGQFDPFPLTEETASESPQANPGPVLRRLPWGQIIAFSMLRGWDEGYDVPSFGITVDVDFQGGLGTRMTAWTLEQARATRLQASPPLRLRPKQSSTSDL